MRAGAGVGSSADAHAAPTRHATVAPQSTVLSMLVLPAPRLTCNGEES